MYAVRMSWSMWFDLAFHLASSFSGFSSDIKSFAADADHLFFLMMRLFMGITPLYGSSLRYAGLPSLVWGWGTISFFTRFVGIAMAGICSSFLVNLQGTNCV